MSPGPKLRVGIVAGALFALTLSHFTTPAHSAATHDFLFKATYLPLILAGLWFGARGAALASGVTCGLYLVHIFGQLAGHGHHDLWSILSDVVLFTVMSFMTGILSDRREAARRETEKRALELEEKTRVLLTAEERLRRSERLRSLGELAAGVAHEIRNPLAGIRGAGDILAKDDTDPAARAEFAEILRSEIQRLNEVVENVLDFARPPEPSTQPVSLYGEAEAVLRLVSRTAEDAGVSCAIEGDRDIRVPTDPDLLRQVLLNLSLNAIQAMPDGGRLAVRLVDGGLELEDTGCGIPEELLETAFDPFVTSRPEGTGLGLATSHRIMESLGGRLEIVRTGPDGTLIRLEFAE